MNAVTPIVKIPHLTERGHVTQSRVVASEWTKFITLRSTLWSLGVGMFLGLPLRRRFSPERFRVLVLLLLVAGAVAAVGKAFT